MSTLAILWFALFPSEPWEIPLHKLDFYVTDTFATNLAAVAADGTLLLKDQIESRLLFVNADGSLRKTFGAKGLGPGEFYFIDGLAWVSDLQAFFVTDRGTKRISKFDAKGELLEEFTAPFLRGPVFDQKGRFFYMTRSGSAAYRNSIVGYSLADRTENQLFSADMEKIATMMVWHGHLVYAPGSDFLVATHSGKDPIYILDKVSGQPLATWQPKLPRIPLSKSFRDDYMKNFMTRVFSKGRPPEGFQVDHRDEWPRLHTIKVDDQDRIWIFLHRGSDTLPTPYRVYDAKGNMLGSGKFQGRPQDFDKDFLYVIKESAEDHVLIRHKIKELLSCCP